MYTIMAAKTGVSPRPLDYAQTGAEANRKANAYRKRYPRLFIYIESTGARSNPPEKIPVVIERTMQEVAPWPM